MDRKKLKNVSDPGSRGDPAASKPSFKSDKVKKVLSDAPPSKQEPASNPEDSAGDKVDDKVQHKVKKVPSDAPPSKQEPASNREDSAVSGKTVDQIRSEFSLTLAERKKRFKEQLATHRPYLRMDMRCQFEREENPVQFPERAHPQTTFTYNEKDFTVNFKSILKVSESTESSKQKSEKRDASDRSLNEKVDDWTPLITNTDHDPNANNKKLLKITEPTGPFMQKRKKIRIEETSPPTEDDASIPMKSIFPVHDPDLCGSKENSKDGETGATAGPADGDKKTGSGKKIRFSTDTTPVGWFLEHGLEHEEFFHPEGYSEPAMGEKLRQPNSAPPQVPVVLQTDVPVAVAKATKDLSELGAKPKRAVTFSSNLEFVPVKKDEKKMELSLLPSVVVPWECVAFNDKEYLLFIEQLKAVWQRFEHGQSMAEIVKERFRKLTQFYPELALARSEVAAFFFVKEGQDELVFPKDLYKIVALGAGDSSCTSCYTVDGTKLHDCHAITIARRALLRYLYKEVWLCFRPDPGARRESIFQISSRGNLLELKSKYSLHLYTNHCPEGLGESCLTDDKGSPIIELHSHMKDSVLPVDDISWIDWMENIACMSACDKLASWTITGIQGALLSHLIKPVYITSMVLGTKNDYAKEVDHAINMRLGQGWEKILPPFYKKQSLLIVSGSIMEPESATNSIRCQLSINWCFGDKKAEIVDPKKGYLYQSFDSPSGKSSRLCKKALGCYFRQVGGQSGYNTYGMAMNYSNIKLRARNYQVVKQQVRNKFQAVSAGAWPSKVAPDNFSF